MTRAQLRILACLTSIAALGPIPREAKAQSDGPEYMPSDVLLLLDTSGSMSYTTVRDPEDLARYGLPRCGSFEGRNGADRTRPMSFDDSVALNDASQTPADRWAILVNAFTGTIVGPACSAQDRATDEFSREFSLEATPSPSPPRVYDADYHLPFNRIVATDGEAQCTPAPSWNPVFRNAYFTGNPMEWPGIAVRWRNFSAPFDTDVSCPFAPQLNDGIINQLGSMVRFGIMTFDPTPHRPDLSIGTGLVSSSISFTADFIGGAEDTWSYFEGWLQGASGNPSQGWPEGCEPTTGSSGWYEVGARNPAAPPWEGRLIGFGNPTDSSERIADHNELVRQAILGMRPYGGTPLAGMLADAVFFLLRDDTGPEHVGGVDFYGGARDPYVHLTDRLERGCRKRIVLLITDGGPNLDLQPHCNRSQSVPPSEDGRCPYKTPQDYAAELYEHNIDLFVVGFSVTAGAGSELTCQRLMDPADSAHMSCEDLPSCTASCNSNSCAYGYCISNPTEELLAVCCNIEGIANAGSRYTPADGLGLVDSPRHAYWAESGAALVATVSNILRFPPSSLTRTQPVFALGNLVATGAPGQIAGARFFSSYEPVVEDLHVGQLVRERYECLSDPMVAGSGPVAQPVEIDVNMGDQFGVNVNGDTSLFDNRAQRMIYTVVADNGTGHEIYSERSVRPVLDSGGVEVDGVGTIGGGMISSVASSFVTSVAPGAMLRPAACISSGPCCPNYSAGADPTPTDCRTRFLSRQLGFTDPSDSESSYIRTSAFGAIINSTPAIVTAPSAYLRDESYKLFQSDFKTRPPVLYAATADGQVHAFTINHVGRGLNELWSFIPPAVLPSIADQFPTRSSAVNKTMISGPLVSDEVAGDNVLPALTTGPFLTRTAPNPEVQDRAKWYTVLLGSFGTSGGYFALDVSNPEPTVARTGYSMGPRFLWQLTTDADGSPLFGERTTRPAVATLYFVMPGASAPAQHAVAILPGGYGGRRVDGESDPVSGAVVSNSGVVPRDHIVRYSARTDNTAGHLSLGGARSITIVRLDTGEVVRTFRQSASYNHDAPEAPVALYDRNRVTQAPFGVPIVGSVVAYPNGPGTIADRAFVGDAEGRLWRMDLSSANPADWSVALFHDAYPRSGPGGDFAFSDGEPIETPPILSTDPMGRLTIAVSTGEQASLGQTGNYSVWSLSEWREAGEIVSHVNWFLNNSNAQGGRFAPNTGERVTGPMALFSSVLYFTTYDPSSIDLSTCSPGQSYLWGVHYLQAGTSGTEISTDPRDGPMPQFRDTVGTGLVRNVVMDGMAFGVGVEQVPSCIATAESDDLVLGLEHQSVTHVSPGAFQLVVQLGGASSGGENSVVSTAVFELPPPSARSLIDSWAAILE